MLFAVCFGGTNPVYFTAESGNHFIVSGKLVSNNFWSVFCFCSVVVLLLRVPYGHSRSYTIECSLWAKWSRRMAPDGFSMAWQRKKKCKQIVWAHKFGQPQPKCDRLTKLHAPFIGVRPQMGQARWWGEGALGWWACRACVAPLWFRSALWLVWIFDSGEAGMCQLPATRINAQTHTQTRDLNS